MAKQLMRAARQEEAAMLAEEISSLGKEHVKGRARRIASRFVRAGVSALLAAALVPVAQATIDANPPASQAFAAQGSMDYNSLFKITNHWGTPAALLGANTIRTVSTNSPNYYADTGYGGNALRWRSTGNFSSKQPVALSHDWEIRITCTMPDISILDVGKTAITAESGVDLTRAANSGSYTYDRCRLRVMRKSDNGSKSNALGSFGQKDGAITNFPSVALGTISDKTSFVYTYTYATDTITLVSFGKKITQANIRTNLGCDQVNVSIFGALGWSNTLNPEVAQIAPGYEMTMTFDSISIPHLDPKIQEVRIFDAVTGAQIHDTDTVPDNTIVRVECVVRNSDSRAVGESFPMHLKIANTAGHPTSGLTPFYDASHPLKVDGVVQDISSSDNTPSGKNGVPLMLPGTGQAKVSYYAKINQASGAAVVLSQQLIDDSFESSVHDTTTLLAERFLKEAPVNPGGSAKPGSDYHFTRLPQANENGWNNSAVTVQFFGGDYDLFTVTPANGDAPTTLADKKTWVRSSDTGDYGIKLQAKNATTNLVSVAKTDTVKIDSAAPRLSVNPALGVLVVDDRSPDGSHAVSGVWRLYRTDAAGAVSTLSRAGADRVFTLTNGVGQPTQSVAGLPDGYYVAEDAAGNLSAPIQVGDVSGGGAAGSGSDKPDGPQPPVITPVTPGGADGGKPLEPTKVTVDEPTGTTSATVEDVMTVQTAPNMLTADKASALLLDRYKVSSATGGQVTWGAPQLFNADGKPVDAIDQAIPGDWYIEMQAKDEAGNTTTLRVRYQVRGSGVSGAMTGVPSDNGNDASSGDKGASGSGDGDGKGGLGTVLTKLPQTGALLGECPLHGMFLLLMVLVSAYSMMRLRQESCREKEERYDACR